MTELIKTLQDYFTESPSQFEFNASMFIAGDSNKQTRVQLIEYLTGKKMPVTKCSYHSCVTALINNFTQTQLF